MMGNKNCPPGLLWQTEGKMKEAKWVLQVVGLTQIQNMFQSGQCKTNRVFQATIPALYD
jgi:hypothetical protein